MYKIFIILIPLFLFSCDDSIDTILKGHYYFKSDFPVTVSINDSFKENIYANSSELDYTFSIYETESGFVPKSCIKINSDIKQNIHIEVNLTAMRLKENVQIFDIYDNIFEYCY